MLVSIKNLYSVRQVREFDRIAIEEYKIPGYILMQRAGQAAFLALKKYWPKAQNITVVCGKGNNAGDGYVIAKLAKESGLNVTVLYLYSPKELSGDALLAAKDCFAAGVKALPFAINLLLCADIIVDALLGTGLQGEIKDPYKEAIAAINDTKIPILAVDVPSGLDADTGSIVTNAINANITITFIAAKQGLFTGQARDYCGEVLLDNLDVPQTIFNKLSASAYLMSLEASNSYMQQRKRIAYKGDFGHVLVVGGDYGMAGAARMAAEAAARIGAGLVTVATRHEHVAIVSGMCPELMCYAVTDANSLLPLLKRATVVVLGPGLGRADWSKNLWQAAIDMDKTMVIDADALNLLAIIPKKSRNWILTPHVGEAARLLRCDNVIVQSNRFAAAQKINDNYGGICVLKGAGTLVSSTNALAICPYGNPGMATAGMGDVLSGVIGGLLAQGLMLEQAAQYGVTLHAKAADLAAKENGERGLLALDLLPYLRKLINYGCIS